LNSGLVAYYPFNGNANDESGNDNHGTVHGAVSYVEGESGDQAIYIDNPHGDTGLQITQYVEIPYSQSLADLEDSSLTIYILYRSTDTDQVNGRLFGHKPYLVMDYNAGRNVQAYAHVGDAENTYLVADEADNDPNAVTTDGKYHSQILVLDRENKIAKQYVDNFLIDTAQTDSLGSLNLDSLVLGATSPYDTSGSRLTSVDEVRIYDRPLSEAEIQELYEMRPDTDRGLVAYYPFNGNANDESGNGHDGTVNGPVLTTDRLGNADSAYRFDGSDDYIQIADSPLLDISQEFTIQAWIRPDDGYGRQEGSQENGHIDIVSWTGLGPMAMLSVSSKPLVFWACRPFSRVKPVMTMF